MLKMMRGALLAAGAVALTLTGCAPEAPADTPTDDPAQETVVEDVPAEEDGQPETPSNETPAEDEPSEPKDVQPDQAIMDSMTCEAFSPELLEQITLRFGAPQQGVSVLVDDHNLTDDIWWVVVMTHPSPSGQTFIRSAYLTNALQLDYISDGLWIELPSENRWQNVSWEGELLVRGQSALTKAIDFLDTSA
ncbi:hypothetical protein [Thermophilibacter provencensis]|uniref:Lipoprotein n=1 Tax=Thermophilibacter provencensis TaxID=1852386 RepID=A0ABT7V239_9ACTN|nr:hypothetical protein [Thermophilibacter provencensis]MDM8270676.1 hypothetical protein [Thermophilibacter provencensis]